MDTADIAASVAHIDWTGPAADSKAVAAGSPAHMPEAAAPAQLALVADSKAFVAAGNRAVAAGSVS